MILIRDHCKRTDSGTCKYRIRIRMKGERIMTDKRKIDAKELSNVSGGRSVGPALGWMKATVYGVKHYLPLRNSPDFDEENELSNRFYNGDTIEVFPETVHGDFIWARKQLGSAEGWINGNKVSIIYE